MIFAQTNRYAKRHHLFSPDDRQGASVAHADLLRAVLTYSDIEAVEIFVSASPRRAPAINLEFAELRDEFPQKSILLRNYDDIASLEMDSRYVFYSSGVFLSQLAQTRLSTGKEFPICTLSHALDIPMVQFFLPGAILLAAAHDAIITSSDAGKRTLHKLIQASQQILEERFGKADLLVEGPRVVTIPLGVDIGMLYPRDKRTARELLDLPPDEVILLYVGRLSEEHKADLEPLLIVLRDLRRKTPGVSLLIAGNDQDNSYFGELDAMAVRLGVKPNVHFLLNFQDFLKPFVYSASDVLVAPSDNIQETFGIAILEAMACGLPVVAADWSGYREIVIHGRTGFLVPTIWNGEAADQVSLQAPQLSDSGRRHMLSQQTVVSVRDMHQYIGTLIRNSELRSRFGEEGLRRVRAEFSWKSIIRIHESLWNDLVNQLNTHRRRRPVTLLDNWDAAFSHFATASLDLGTVVTRSAMRADIADALQFRPFRAGYEGLNLAELRRVLERASIQPVSVRQLIQDRVVKDSLSTVWLLKKGYLSIAGTDA